MREVIQVEWTECWIHHIRVESRDVCLRAMDWRGKSCDVCVCVLCLRVIRWPRQFDEVS